MSLTTKLFNPVITTIQDFQKIWVQQKFSKRFENAKAIYIKGHNVYPLPAILTPDLQFILPKGINRVFTTDSCSQDDKGDRTYEWHDEITGNVVPAYFLYEGNPVAVKFRNPKADEKEYDRKVKELKTNFGERINELEVQRDKSDNDELKKDLNKQINFLQNLMQEKLVMAQSLDNYYVDSNLTAVAFKFFMYIVLRFMTDRNKKELFLILVAWGAFCLFVGSILTLMVT